MSTGDLRVRAAALRAALLDRVRASLQMQRKEAVAVAVLVTLVVTGAGLAYARTRPASAASIAPVEAASAAPDAGSVLGQIVVHVVGAVRKPGVYDFADGSRVIDAIEAAGGFTSKAATDGINLARPLVDGEQLVVPRRGEVGAGAAPGAPGVTGSTGGKVNINIAAGSDFDSLPGIGPVLAERIVAYREQHGPFRSVTDLQKVSGIGPKKFESIEPLVTV